MTKAFSPAPVLLLTGLPGAGKTTIAQRFVDLYSEVVSPRIELLDGDEVRRSLSKGLGYFREDREENLRRIGYVAELLSRHGVLVAIAAIAPYQETRDEIRRRLAPRLLEVYVTATIEECERRDPKGMYAKARRGEIIGFTGIDAPYETPASPDLILDTERVSVDDCARKMLRMVYPHA